jgi:hypothetical protein
MSKNMIVTSLKKNMAKLMGQEPPVRIRDIARQFGNIGDDNT